MTTKALKIKKAEREYDESSIRVVRNLVAVRTKPSQFIGPTDDHGIFTIVREPSDNVIDEHEAGRCSEMTIRIRKDGYIEVHDNGQGMPVGWNKEEKMSTLELLVSNLMAGGKLDANSAAYKNTRGTHGIGIKATNALSEHFVVFTCRDKKWWGIAYKKGIKTSDFAETTFKAISAFVEPCYTKGTMLIFKPDATIFDKGAKLDVAMVREWCENSAYLTAGFTINLIIEGQKKPEIFHKDGGVNDWLSETIAMLGCGTLSDKSVQLKGEHFELVLQFTDAPGSQVWSYTNGLFQSEGGNHLNITQSALFASLKNYGNGKTASVKREDICEGVVGLINFKVDSPKFSSQDKIKLTDSRFEEFCKKEIDKGLAAFWDKNKSLARQIMTRAGDLTKMKAAFAVTKATARDLKAHSSGLGRLPTKLASVRCKVDEREVFLVEGDSAAGPSRGARMTVPYRYQETLALKGKPKNAMKDKLATVLASDEVKSVLSAIGFDPDAKNPLSKLRCSKIVLLSDPDPDGFHIDCLVMALLAVVIPEVFTAGMVYTVKSPKYLLRDKGIQYFAMDLDELRSKLPKGVDIARASYLKGWGELSTQTAMRTIAFDPATRQLVQIAPPTAKEFEEFQKLMGLDVAYRRDLLGIGVSDSEE